MASSSNSGLGYFPGNVMIVNATILNTIQIGDDVAAPVDVLNIYANTVIGSPANNRSLTVNGPVVIAGPITINSDVDFFFSGAEDFSMHDDDIGGDPITREYERTGQLTVRSSASGITLEDYELDGATTTVAYTAGTVTQLRYTAPVALTGLLRGSLFNFTNVTPGLNAVIGYDVTIPAATAVGTRGLSVSSSQRGGAAVYLNMNSVLVAAETARGIHLDFDALNIPAGATFYGLHVDMDAMAIGGTIAGVRIEVPAGVDALQILDGIIRWIPGAGDTFVVAPTAAGLTLFDLQLETEFTSGTIFNADYGAATVPAGAIAGLNLNLRTNITVPTAQQLTGIDVQLARTTHVSSAGIRIRSQQEQNFALSVEQGATLVAGQTLRGLYLFPSGVLGGVSVTAAATYRGISLEHTAGCDASPGGTYDVVYLAYGGYGDAIHLQIENNITTGTLQGVFLRMGVGAAGSLAPGGLIGIDMDLTTNLGGIGGLEVVQGIVIQIPAASQPLSGAININSAQFLGNVFIISANGAMLDAGDTLRGIQVDINSVTPGGTDTVVGINVLASAIAVGLGTIRGISVEMPAAFGVADEIAIRASGDGRRVDIITDTLGMYVLGEVQIDAVAAGTTLLDFVPDTQLTSGTIVNADYGVVTVLAGALTGIGINLATNVTPGAFQVQGASLLIPASTHVDTRAIFAQSAQTQGSVINLDVNSVVGAAGLNALLIDGDGVSNGANTFRALQVDLDGMTVGAGTMVAASIVMPLAIAGTVRGILVDETHATMAGGSSGLTMLRGVRTLTNTQALARTVSQPFIDIDYALVMNNAGGSLALTAGLIDFDMTMTQTLGTLRWDGSIIDLTLAGIISVGGVAVALDLKADGVDQATAVGTFIGLRLDMDGMPVTAGTIRGITVDLPAVFGAADEIGVRVTGDGRTVNLITDTYAAEFGGDINIAGAGILYVAGVNRIDAVGEFRPISFITFQGAVPNSISGAVGQTLTVGAETPIAAVAGPIATFRAGSAGPASGANGGDVAIQPGALDGAGADGVVRLSVRGVARTPDFLPRADNEGNIGLLGTRWSLVRAVTITSGRHVFSDERSGEELWAMHEDGEFLYFEDARTKRSLMKMDREGNLYVRGEVRKWT